MEANWLCDVDTNSIKGFTSDSTDDWKWLVWTCRYEMTNQPRNFAYVRGPICANPSSFFFFFFFFFSFFHFSFPLRNQKI
jgi:hypothetical protein